MQLVVQSAQTFPRPQIFSVKVNNKTFINQKILKTDFTVDSTSFTSSQVCYFVFIPGQFVNLKVDDNTFRSYSLCSDAANHAEFSIVVAVAHNGVGSNYLKSTKIGDSAQIIGPSGRFVLPQTLAGNLVFVATGTGIAPFISMFYSLAAQKYSGKISLLFGIKNEAEIFFINALESFKLHLNLSYQVCLSEPENNSNYNSGRVTKFIAQYISTSSQYFLCGHPNMVEEVSKMLSDAKISAGRIFFEKFTHSKN